ncbi:MAG: YihY/virulence factor BrkB family protein [Desulfobacteraceae bacterium]|nr:YihY/virulence factor BrkB family protein [Desulfobacteraceae bacterium]
MQKLNISKLTKSVLFAVKGFKEDQCILRASALTFYTLLSIVPVMAMAFGVSKGFGLEKMLESQLLSAFPGHEDVTGKIIEFSSNLLRETKSGVMAIPGIILLVWSIIKMFSHIEDSFNTIWWVNNTRTLVRKFADYIALFITASFFLIFSGSLTIFITSEFSNLFGQGILLQSLFHLLPFFTAWLIFIFFYIFIPNTKVNYKAALLGGIIAGTMYQITQILYLNFQIQVTHYNAIYGSFAALPLFLIWLQMSWLILLSGAEMSFAFENIDSLETDDSDFNVISIKNKKLLSLRIILLSVRRFKDSEVSLSASEISNLLRIPNKIVRLLLIDLVKCNILSEVIKGNDKKGFQPARDVETLSIMNAIEILETKGVEKDINISGTIEVEALNDSLEKFSKAAFDSNGNRLFKDI